MNCLPISPSPHPAALPLDRLLVDCQTSRHRRRGPGGQHRNKVETGIVIVHTPSGVRGEASERRSQEQNRQVALFRLRVNLALALRHPRDVFAPSELWQSRCRGMQLAINPTHDDFPALLAEALDVLGTHEMQLRSAAEFLGVTPSQLTKFLKLEPRALQIVNDRRQALGQPQLR